MHGVNTSSVYFLAICCCYLGCCLFSSRQKKKSAREEARMLATDRPWKQKSPIQRNIFKCARFCCCRSYYSTSLLQVITSWDTRSFLQAWQTGVATWSRRKDKKRFPISSRDIGLENWRNVNDLIKTWIWLDNKGRQFVLQVRFVYSSYQSTRT